MDRKIIQEQRKKGYFIEAAKKIIKEEGVANLTVKKVADLAGFAPGTLYNYFADLNALLAYCALDFWEECKEYVLKVAENNDGLKKKIIGSCSAYVDYFFNNPNVFKLMFLEDFGKIPDEIQEKFYNPVVVLLFFRYFEECAEEGLIPRENLKSIVNIVANFIHGILLFYIMGRTQDTREEIQLLLKEQIDYLVNTH